MSGHISLSFIQPQALERYVKAFQAVAGSPDAKTVSGPAASSMLAKSGLSKSVLHSIWELADIRRSGNLALPEFALAMFLVEAKLHNKAVPAQLPPNIYNEVVQATRSILPSSLGPIGFAVSQQQQQQQHQLSVVVDATTNLEEPEADFESRFPTVNPLDPDASNIAVEIAGSSIPGRLTDPGIALSDKVIEDPLANKAIPGLNFSFEADLLGKRAGESEHKWAISPQEKAQYEVIFRKWDPNHRGFLSGTQAREVFMQSGLSNKELGQIWQLADIHNQGKLNLDEFSVAMHLIFRRLAGQPIPRQLPPDLVPKSSHDIDVSLMSIKEQLMFGKVSASLKSAGPSSTSVPRSDSSRPTSLASRQIETIYNDNEDDIPVYRSSHRRRQREARRGSQDASDAFDNSPYNPHNDALSAFSREFSTSASAANSVDELKGLIELRNKELSEAKEQLAMEHTQAAQARVTDRWKVDELKQQIRDLHINTPRLEDVIQQLSSPELQEKIVMRSKRLSLIGEIKSTIRRVPSLVEDYEAISRKLFQARNELIETRRQQAERSSVVSDGSGDGQQVMQARAAQLLAQRMQALTGKTFNPAGSGSSKGGSISDYHKELELSRKTHRQELEKLYGIKSELQRVQQRLKELEAKAGGTSGLVDSDRTWERATGPHSEAIKSLIDELSALRPVPLSALFDKETAVATSLRTGDAGREEMPVAEQLARAISSEDREQILKNLASQRIQDRMQALHSQRSMARGDTMPSSAQAPPSNPFEHALSPMSPFSSGALPERDGRGSEREANEGDNISSIGTSDHSDSEFDGTSAGDTPQKYGTPRSDMPPSELASAGRSSARTPGHSGFGFLEHDFYAHRNKSEDEDSLSTSSSSSSSSLSSGEDWFDSQKLGNAQDKYEVPDSLLEKLNLMSAEVRRTTTSDSNSGDAVSAHTESQSSPVERPKSKSPLSEAFQDVQQTLSSKLFGSGEEKKGKTLHQHLQQEYQEPSSGGNADDDDDDDSWTDASFSYSENSTPVHVDLDDISSSSRSQQQQQKSEALLSSINPNNPFARRI
ncbi:actin organization and endocytosis protein [Spiromyces aspiralis]|uniref:Actin organization and endocytosis protein n=1 Tax=Spiromyces aspiralis TaxID=68401 RepID=A0ACC1HXK3_9FUNG|nr:actin organization and endocytosis protein [Spiromyces aspiralis]